MVVGQFINIPFKRWPSAPEMRNVFGEKNNIQKTLDVEVAWASAEAEFRMMPYVTLWLLHRIAI